MSLKLNLCLNFGGFLGSFWIKKSHYTKTVGGTNVP